MTKRFIQVGLGVLLGLAATAVIFSLPPGGGGPATDAPHRIVPPLPLPAPDATLVDTRGEPAPIVPDAAEGAPAHLVFFGYTHCPDICPLTMGALREVGDRLEAEGLPRPGVTFVTVDPPRDDPERLAEYLERFGERVRGLTGTEEAVRAVASAWGVYIGPLPGGDDAEPAPEDASPETAHGDTATGGAHDGHQGYVVDHTGRTFVVRDGAIVASFAPGTGPDAMASTLRDLLDGGR